METVLYSQKRYIAPPAERSLDHLARFNDTSTAYPRDACLHELFEQCVEHRPDNIALIEGDRKWTYRDLNRQANRLAHALRSLGVGQDQTVAVFLERSADTVVSLLAVLKAGGAYVPLDPTAPPAFLQTLVDETRPVAVITRRRWNTALPDMAAPILCLEDKPGVADQPSTNPGVYPPSDALAYVMYTSGSSGRPKGVEIPHRGVVRLLCGVDYVPLDDKQVFLLLAPVIFDASTFEIWAGLLHGGTCVVYPHRTLDPRELERVIRRHGVTCLWLTAGLFNTLIDERPESLAGVRRLLVGGEALSVPHVRRALECLPGVQLINGYGPTESTTFACCYPIPRRLAPDLKSIPIGRPIGNTTVYLLDSDARPVEIGEVGELYIGGDGLARGYRNRPDLTAKCFVPDPFASRPGGRLYRTGDLGRWLPNGDIEFLGRVDSQVKIRGHRIEPSAIQAVLGQHPDVRQAVVTAPAGPGGVRRLVAYVVPRDGMRPPAGDLRAFLETRLPAYMVPASYMVLDSLPLTPNGKVDHRQLPDPTAVPTDGDREAPSNALQRRLKEIWEGVLGRTDFGVQDDFYASGGDSLLAISLLIEIQRAFGKALSVLDLLRNTTIEQQARLLNSTDKPPKNAAQMDHPSDSPLVPIQPHGSRPPLFLLHEVSGELLSYLPLVHHLGPDQPSYGFHCLTQEHLERPPASVEALSALYTEELLRVRPEGPFYLAGYSFGGLLAFEMAQQLNRRGHKNIFLAIIDLEVPGRSSEPHGRGRWSWEVLRNLGNWLIDDLCRTSPRKACGRLFRKVRKVFRSFGAGSSPRTEDLWDLTRMPAPSRRLWEALYESYLRYVPQPYTGPVAFFRARTNPLFRPLPLDMGWRPFVGGGMEIDRISGSHDGILREPHVSLLAARLRDAMDRFTRHADVENRLSTASPCTSR